MPPKSAAFQKARKRFSALLGQLQAPMSSAYLSGWKELRKLLPEARLAQLINTGGIERLLANAATPQQVATAFAQFGEQIRNGVEKAGKYFIKDVPKLATTTAVGAGQVGIAFDVLSPRVIEAVRALQTKVVTTAVLQEVAPTIRAATEFGLEMGWGPTRTARYIRDVMPLGEKQLKAIQNFRQELGAPRGPRLSTVGGQDGTARVLRDKRYDKLIQRVRAAGGKLTPTQIDKIAKAYERRMIAHNAKTIARTSTLNAMKEGQRLAWESAIQDMGLDPNTVWKTWQTVGDDRVRETHAAMEGNTVLFEETYSNGDNVPGENEFNCRCRSAISISRKDRHATGKGPPPAAPKPAVTKPKPKPANKGQFPQELQTVATEGRQVPADFTGTYTGTLFHGTTQANARSIAAQGVRASTYGAGAEEINFGTTLARISVYDEGGVVVARVKGLRIGPQDVVREVGLAELAKFRQRVRSTIQKYGYESPQVRRLIAFEEAGGVRRLASKRLAKEYGIDAYMQGSDTVVVLNRRALRTFGTYVDGRLAAPKPAAPSSGL